MRLIDLATKCDKTERLPEKKPTTDRKILRDNQEDSTTANTTNSYNAHGTAMGFPVSVVVAETVKQTVKTSTNKP